MSVQPQVGPIDSVSTELKMRQKFMRQPKVGV
jgi:hypothetical protein